MSDDDDPVDESAVALRAKAAHCMKLVQVVSQETRARLILMASEYLERAARLEEEERKRDE